MIVWPWMLDPDIDETKIIDSTNVYSGELPLKVSTNTKPGNISFRMCFTLLKKTQLMRDGILPERTNLAEGEYWSKEVTITVVP